MAFMTKADKAAVQSMQTDEKGMREIERARKNKGKRVRGRPISPERAAQFKSLQQEYDQQVIEQNFKDNNKVLIEAGLEPMTWEEIYGDKIQEHATSREAAEHYIEIIVDDDHCRVMISDDGFNRGQKFMTALGKGKTLRSGQEIYWNLPPKAFKFGGKGYSILKNSNHDTQLYVEWNSQQPKWVVVYVEASNWIAHCDKLLEKYGGRKKDNKYLLPSSLMSIPKIK